MLFMFAVYWFRGENVISESIIAYQMPGAVLIHVSKESTFEAIAVIGKPPNQVHEKAL